MSIKTNSLYKLYLDETGTIGKTPKGYFPYFILSGIAINSFQAEYLKVKADQIKFKYWGKTDIVFHSKEIGKRENDFAILKDPQVEANFHNDLVNFLNKNHAKSIIVSVNKEKAFSLGWNSMDIFEKAASAMIEFFIEFLNKKKSRGQIFVESADAGKDVSFLKKYTYYLSRGLPSMDLSPMDIKELLTSVSFVSKRNFDIETQIADLFAYPAGNECMVNDGAKKRISNSYEDKMCGVIQSKLINIKGRTSFLHMP